MAVFTNTNRHGRFPIQLWLQSRGTEHGRRMHMSLRYRPLIVHACHCRWCQRETGTAFALNALYEADCVTHLGAEPEIVVTPSLSGKGQHIARCRSCRVSIWSNSWSRCALRPGWHLDEPDRLRRIFISSRLRSSHGSDFHRAQRRRLSFMIWRSRGQPKALSGVGNAGEG